MCQLYCMVFVTIALFLAQGANASALSRQVDPCNGYCMNGFNCSLISHLHCECSWEYKGDRCQEKVFVLRHDFGTTKDLKMLGDLIDLPELGPDGEAFIGRINKGQEFRLWEAGVGTKGANGTDTCVSFSYRVEATGTVLALFFYDSNLTPHPQRSLVTIENPSPNEPRKWNNVRYDLPKENFNKDALLTIYGSTKKSSGRLFVDDVMIAERKCADVFGV